MSAKAKAAKATADEVNELIDFARQRRRAQQRALCAVCKLPEAVRDALKVVRSRKIPRADVLLWLAQKGYRKIKSTDLDSHNQGNHDERT